MTLAKFEFDRARARRYVRSASNSALVSAAEVGRVAWNSFAPVSSDPRTSGQLRASWFTRRTSGVSGERLVIGASARHAIFVELGTVKMAPRAPLRATAGEVTAALPGLVSQALGI